MKWNATVAYAASSRVTEPAFLRHRGRLLIPDVRMSVFVTVNEVTLISYSTKAKVPSSARITTLNNDDGGRGFLHEFASLIYISTQVTTVFHWENSYFKKK